MDENTSWKFPAAFFVTAVAALLVAGAYRTIELNQPPATGAVVAPASSPASNAEAPSNDVADFPQLD